MFGGKELVESRTLAEYGLQSESTVQAVGRLPGGGGRRRKKVGWRVCWSNFNVAVQSKPMKKASASVPTQFDCMFCNHAKTVDCKL